MTVVPPRKVICRHYQDGETLDVLGLNRFTLLLDRSETALTEAGWNYWKPGLDGPPHFHDGKEQFFFAVEGEGEVTIAGETFQVEPNCLLHVPLGAMHRTVVKGEAAQAYFLVNAFSDSDKEGKATFIDHLAVSKHERRRQADEANRGLPIDWHRVHAVGTLVRVEPSLPPPGTAGETLLIARERTRRLSASVLRLGGEQALSLPGETPAAERTLFGLAGAGRLETPGQRHSINAGTVIYVPPGLAATAQAGPEGCVCLSIQTYLD